MDVAQPDRVPAYEAGGWGFESLRSRHMGQYSVIGITPDCKSGASCGCRFKSYLAHHILTVERSRMMEKFIPYEKRSKREQRKINQAKRGTWGEINPVTRKPTSSKAYNRKRAQDWKKDLPELRLHCYCVKLHLSSKKKRTDCDKTALDFVACIRCN